MRIILIAIAIIIISSFATAQQRKIIKKVKAAESQLSYHAGLVVYDPSKNKTLISYQGDRYFTPASNTKIFTLYTSMKILGDSIPGIYYSSQADSLTLWGSGDPSLFYENVTESRVASFLQSREEKYIFLSDAHFSDSHFGPGWSWDDYSYSYQVEKAALPLFGNYFRVSKKDSSEHLTIDLNYFKRYFTIRDSLTGSLPVLRSYGDNLTDYFPQKWARGFEEVVPFRYSNFLAAELLSDTLSRQVFAKKKPLDPNRQIVYSVPSDSLYRVLMQTSDNFIAEQLLLTCAGVLSDTLSSMIAIRYSKENFLSDLPDEPLWVDGSGLSRYNQFTPRSIVKLWDKLYRDFGPDRLFPILAVGGQSGTIKSWYGAEKPYVYGKTGTLRNHHSLSGYLLTDKGNTLIFSYMHGHYPGPSSTVKKEMERILLMIKEKY